MYYYGTNMNFKQAYNFVRIPISDDATKNPFHGAEVVARIPSRWKMNIGYAHSFGVTDNYFVHIEQPLTLSLPRIMTLNIRGAPISDSFVCHPNEPMSFILVSKKTGEKIPITYLAPHGFVFHFINCYEEADHVICDICLYNSSEIIRSAYIEQIINSINSDNSSQLPEANYARFVLPLSLAGAKPGENLVKLPDSCATAVLREGTTDTLDVTREKMFDDSYSFDLPRINDDYAGIKFRYTYGTTIFASDRRLLKLDAVERSVAEWTCESTHQPGEPVFVPRPGSTQEDDGVVMCTILANTTDYSSYLVILDAHSFKEIARASVPSDMKMSLTFHGFFSQRH
ncbi:beta,beta-carotene 15,15'-dioxygenase [Aplysia californica]|uniref:Beta,beta-carotene 15,15'-dioxygenase n=1 Tax=Aplysia californica TaxID=6500 RepID=A0ABM1ACS7_APLCA|nr:beta,beta-carotene 15,15'-dioxygenase [Aplysia californica]